MNHNADLKVIQRKVYMSYFQDGLWDILLGSYLIGWGLSIIFDFVAIMGGVWIAFYFLVLGLKKRLTYPRAGYIKIPEARKQQMKMVILGAVIFLLGLAVFSLFMYSNRPTWLDDYFMFMLSTVLALVIAVLGYWWKVIRWYIYAGITFISAALYQWFDILLEIMFVVPGGIIIISGLVFLTRFLRKYPKPAGEGIDVGQA